jgi:hypothetical protein
MLRCILLTRPTENRLCDSSRIKDLLNPAEDNLPIREHPTRGIYVDGLTKAVAHSSDEIMEVVTLGDSVRATASTNMNDCSSRSHSVFGAPAAPVRSLRWGAA